MPTSKINDNQKLSQELKEYIYIYNYHYETNEIAKINETNITEIESWISDVYIHAKYERVLKYVTQRTYL